MTPTQPLVTIPGFALRLLRGVAGTLFGLRITPRNIQSWKAQSYMNIEYAHWGLSRQYTLINSDGVQKASSARYLIMNIYIFHSIGGGQLDITGAVRDEKVE